MKILLKDQGSSVINSGTTTKYFSLGRGASQGWLNFILWVKILLKDQGSCVINSGTTTKYFSLGRRASQGDPISAFFYLF